MKILLFVLINLLILNLIYKNDKEYKNKVEFQLEVLDVMVNEMSGVSMKDVQDWIDDTCKELGLERGEADE